MTEAGGSDGEESSEEEARVEEIPITLSRSDQTLNYQFEGVKQEGEENKRKKVN
jgi:hypothetical protein